MVPPPFKSVSQTGWERFAGRPGALAIGATNAGLLAGLMQSPLKRWTWPGRRIPWAEGAGEIAGVLANQGAANRLFSDGAHPEPDCPQSCL